MSQARRYLSFTVIALCCIAASACTPPESERSSEMTRAHAETVATLGFNELLQNYLRPQCAQQACHGGDRGIAGLRLMEAEEAYTQLIDVNPTSGPASEAGLRRVTPNSVDRSLLWAKLTLSVAELSERGWGAPMPSAGGRRPGPQTLELLRDWIEAGAPFDGVTLADLGTQFDIEESPSDDLYVPCDVSGQASATDMQRCFLPPPSGDSVVRLYTPRLTIPPHTETLICSYLEMPVDQPLYVNRTAGQQMIGGHHAAVFLAVSPSDEAPHECRDDEMSNFRFAAGAGGGGGQDTQLPPDVAIKIEPGQQFVIQSHYLNPSAEPITVMDAVDLVTIPASDMTTRVDPFAMLHGSFEIPPDGESFEIRKRCRLESDLEIYMLLGHTHDYGVLFEFYHHSQLLDEPRKLYHATDGPLLRDNPEIKYFDPPLPFLAGDEVEMRCVWENSSDEPLGWPEEMCVALMYYGPGQGWMTCDEDDDVPQRPTMSSGEGCVDVTAEGNEIGVGRACTASGGECADQDQARLCLATFDPRANFCSFLGCERDDQCGAGASCLAQGPATACVPTSCAD